MIQVNSGAHHPVRRTWKPSSREQRKLTRTRLPFPLHREWHQHCSSQTGLLRRKQTWLFPQGESWSELFSAASLTCFPVRRSKCSWFSPAGMEGGVDFRNQVLSQPWKPGNPNTPITYFTSNPRVIGQGIWSHENLSFFFQTPLRAEQNARMSELEGLPKS